MRYYIADLHFYHKSINEKMDCRGFATVDDMNRYMIGKWNGKVRKNDDVIILGDFSWGTAEQTNEILSQLNGRLYLIQGNHDRIINYRKMDVSRFGWIKPYEEMYDNKRKVILCHYPIMCYNGQYKLDKEGNPITYMLYGHVHDTMDERLLEQFRDMTRKTKVINAAGEEQYIPCNMINCFCVYSDYEPLTLDEWIACTAQRMAK